MTKPLIPPTEGREVWYFPGEHAGGMIRHDPKRQMSAKICYVWNDRLVTLQVLDHGALAHVRTSVRLLQEDDPVPEYGGYCTWMPYQLGQASKQMEIPFSVVVEATPLPKIDAVGWQMPDPPTPFSMGKSSP